MAEKVEKKHTNLEDTFSITMELQRPLLKDEDDENEEIINIKNIEQKKYKNWLKYISYSFFSRDY